MPQRIPLTLGRKADKAASPAVSIENLTNGYMETVPDGKEPTPIYGSPGFVEWADVGTGPIRAKFEMSGLLYVVSGSSLYSVDADTNATALGDIGPGLSLVSIAGDGINVVVVNEPTIYVYNVVTLAFAAVTDEDVSAASTVSWVDGFFVFTIPDTGEWFISALTDPTAYDALDFSAAEWKPDNVVTSFVLKRTLFLAGVKTIEAQRNVGDLDFPFVRDESVFIDSGVAGKFAVATTNDTAYWHARDGTVRRLDGLVPTRISTPAIEAAIAKWARPELTYASSHVWMGHLLIIFRNPDGCVLYDEATKFWHNRRSYRSDTWRAQCFAECYDLKLFGDAASGKVYRLDDEAFDEAGEILPLEIVTPYAYLGGLRMTISELEVIAQTGVGGLVDQPLISCERTEDGETWVRRKYRPLGKTGKRNTTTKFGSQGQSKGCAFKLSITDPVRRAILGIYATLDFEQ